MKNIQEVYEFGQAWRGTENFQVMPVGNFVFGARITYISDARGTERENCTVMMVRNGIQDGEINIYEKGILTASTHHLGLNSNFQDYEFDRNDESFVITGKSPKMGEYSIRISPNGTVPTFI